MIDVKVEKSVNNTMLDIKSERGKNKMCSLTNIESQIKEINLKIDELTKIPQKSN